MSGKSECIPYPYVGSKVSLISKSERRYEGILQMSDVALAKVRSFGTEDRPTDRPVAPSDEDFGYMTFCGSDIKEIRVCKTQINDECQKQVINHLDSLFTEKNLADVEITCEGEVFNCHQNILSARSPVFLTMFRADMSEKHSKKVHIPDVRKEVFLEVLKFIYTGNVSSEDSLKEHAREILAAANKYELDLLKKLCEAQLVSALDASNCLDLLVLGDLHEAEKLKMVALDFVSMNFPSLVQQDIYKDFIRQYPDLVFEVTKSVASKMESNNN